MSGEDLPATPSGAPLSLREPGPGPASRLPTPSLRAFVLLGLVTLLSIFGFTTPWLGAVSLGFDALILAAVWWDGRQAAATPLAFARDAPAVVHQGESTGLDLWVAAPDDRVVRLHLREVWCPELTAEPVDRRLGVRGVHREGFDVVPRLRGPADLAPLGVRVLGPWGLAWAQRQVDLPVALRVYPRAHLEGEAGLLLRHALERRTGANPVSRRGFSTELYALREYLPGDQLRNIHWKASARQRRPVTREDAWEQHQHVVILVDCGRPMASLADRYSKLDHSLAMVLALTRVILAQHDSATLVLFSKEIRRLVRVDRRTRSFARVFEAVHDVRADLDEPDYAAVAAWVARKVPRRSLALVCTSVIDLTGADQLAEALTRLARRHRPLLVNLEDPGLYDIARSSPQTTLEAYAKVSAMAMEHGNLALHTRLRGRGIDVVSAPASQLPLQLLQRYLDLKARRRA